MITIRGNLKTGEWREIERHADPRDVTLDQAAGAIARLLMKRGCETWSKHRRNVKSAETVKAP